MQPKRNTMESADLNSRGSNQPSLYDTSTSTTESWNAGGRRTYPSYYFPKTTTTPRTQHLSQSPGHSPKRSSPRHSPMQQYHDYHPGKTQSEPGVPIEQDKFAAYASRFSALEQRRDYAQSEIGASELVRKYKQRYSDQGLLSSQEERRQAASPLQPMDERHSGNSRNSYPYKRQSRYESNKSQTIPRDTSIQPNHSHELEVSTDSVNESFQHSSRSSIETPTPKNVQDLRGMLWNEEEVLKVAVPPTLAYAEGSYYDRRASYNPHEIEMAGKRGQRPSRSLSPGRRSMGSGDGGTFKSKFYDAALAARLRAKIHPADVEPIAIPQEVMHPPQRQSSGRGGSFSLHERTSFSSSNRPFDETSPEPQKIVTSVSPHLEQPKDSSHASWMNNSRSRDDSSGRISSTSRVSESLGLSRTSSRNDSFHEQQVVVEPRRGREYSRERSSVRESSLDRRGGHYSSERIGRGLSQERRGRKSSQEHSRAREFLRERQNSQEPRGRAPSPFIERRMREYSQEPRGRQSTSSSSDRPSRGYSAEPCGSPSDFDRLAREFSGEVHHMKVSSTAVEHERRDNLSGERRVKDRPTVDKGRSSSVEHRAIEDVQAESKQNTSNGSSAHSDVAAFWQNKARASSPIPTPNLKSMSNYGYISSCSGSRGSSLGKGKISKKDYDKKNMEKLVAKLNSVNRDNPTEALAVIDSILRQESRSSSGEPEEPVRGTLGETTKRESPTPIDNDSDGDESSGETSVSSITNPTYQEVKPQQDQAKVLNPFAPDSSFPNHFHSKESTSKQYPPSTSTFRRPRPSALQNYASATQQELSALPTKQRALSKAKERRQHLKEFPPPSTIDVKDTGVASSIIEPIPKKLDKFLSKSEELAAKIRVWDDMSHGKKSKSSEFGNDEPHRGQQSHVTEQAFIPKLPAPPKVPSRRSHPWDDEIPAIHEKVNTMHISKEDEIGFEAVMMRRRKEAFEEPYLFDAAQECLKTAIKFGRSNSTPAVSNDGFNDSFEAGPSPFFSETNLRGWETTPRMTPQQQERTQKISDEFDAAWTSIPSSSFFPDEETGFRKRPPAPKTGPVDLDVSYDNSLVYDTEVTMQNRPKAPKSGPVDLDLSFDTSYDTEATPQKNQDSPHWAGGDLLNTSGERAEIEVSLISQEPQEDRSKGRSAAGSASETSRSTPKRKGFLRAFIRRSEKKSNKTGAPLSQSVSQTSVGAQSLPLLTQQQPARPTPPSFPGLDQQEAPPPRGRRNSRSNTRPPRTRSESMERFRTASMAQKFSRVMRLYEHE